MGGPAANLRTKRRTHAAAAAGSVALHLLFAIAIFATASGTMPRGASDPFGEGEAIEVAMEGSEGTSGGAGRASTTDVQSQTDALDQLARRVRAEQSELMVKQMEPVRKPGGLPGLFQAIGSIRAPGRQGQGTASSGRQPQTGQDASSARASRAGVPARDDGSAGLWGQIEPCWKRLPHRSNVPVTLEIRLNAEGRLAAPPRIVRPGMGQPDEQRLLAEAQAMAALQACLPYRSGRNGVYRLGFNAAP
jgi:hypothetical protein